MQRKTHNHLKKEFEMKDLGKINFYLGLQIEHLQMGILVHQSGYIKKVLEKFNIDKAYLLRTSKIIRALKNDTDPFMLKQEGEEVLGVEYTYLSVIGALMYLTNNIRPDIVFAVNWLLRHSAAFIMHHWNDIKNIL
jgi:hypothetical protein